MNRFYSKCLYQYVYTKRKREKEKEKIHTFVKFVKKKN